MFLHILYVIWTEKHGSERVKGLALELLLFPTPQTFFKVFETLKVLDEQRKLVAMETKLLSLLVQEPSCVKHSFGADPGFCEKGSSFGVCSILRIIWQAFY